MTPYGLQNAQKITPNWPPEPPGTPKGAQNSIFYFWDRIWSSFWVPAGAQKSSQNRLFAKRGQSKRVLFVNFVASVVFLDFGFDFSSIFHQKSMLFWSCFLGSLLFLMMAATFTIVCVLQCFKQFSLFPLFGFLPKITQKNIKQTRSQKSI